MSIHIWTGEFRPLNSISKLTRNYSSTFFFPVFGLWVDFLFGWFWFFLWSLILTGENDLQKACFPGVQNVLLSYPKEVSKLYIGFFRGHFLSNAQKHLFTDVHQNKFIELCHRNCLQIYWEVQHVSSLNVCGLLPFKFWLLNNSTITKDRLPWNTALRETDFSSSICLHSKDQKKAHCSSQIVIFICLALARLDFSQCFFQGTDPQPALSNWLVLLQRPYEFLYWYLWFPNQFESILQKHTWTRLNNKLERFTTSLCWSKKLDHPHCNVALRVVMFWHPTPGSFCIHYQKASLPVAHKARWSHLFCPGTK